jgi:hypothetical protein
MTSFMRNALLGAAGVVAMSLSANAAGSTVVTDTTQLKSAAAPDLIKEARGPGVHSFRSENPGGAGFKKKKKKKS